MSNVKLKDYQKIADERRTRQLINNGLLSLFEVYDEIPVAVHLVNILRSKGKIVDHKEDGTPVYRDPYTLTDAQFLKDLEAYEIDLRKTKTEDEDE